MGMSGRMNATCRKICLLPWISVIVAIGHAAYRACTYFPPNRNGLIWVGRDIFRTEVQFALLSQFSGVMSFGDPVSSNRCLTN